MGTRASLYAALLALAPLASPAGAAAGVSAPAAHASPTPTPSPHAPAVAPTLAPAWRTHADPFFHALFRDVDDAPIGIPSAIARDGRGFVWVGYVEGLARWDGVEFKTYGAETTAKGPVLPETAVSSLHADAAGDLWIGLHTQGLLRYDAARDAFVRPATRTALDHSAIGDIADAADGGLWVASSVGLAHVDRAGGRVALDASGWLARGVEHVVAIPLGGVWASRGGDLAHRDAHGRWTPVAQAASGGDAPIAGLTADEAGRTWVVRRDGAIAVLDADGRPVRRLQAPGDGSLALTSVSAAHGGRIWIGGDQGLYAIDTAGFAIRRVRHDAMRSSSLPQDAVTALDVDRGGLLWVGSDAAMSVCDLDPREAFGLSSAFASRTGDPHSTPMAVRTAPDGTLWLGQLNGPLQRMDAASGRAVAVGAGSGSTPAPRSVLSMAIPPGGPVLAAARNGLFEVGLDGRGLRRLSPAPVRRVLADGADLYVGDTEGVGRAALAHPEAVTPLPGLPHGAGEQVNALARGPTGTIWIGGQHGLYRFDPRLQRAGRVQEAGASRAGRPVLDSQYVTTLRFDRTGRLWVGAIGGLFLVTGPDTAHATVRRFGLDDGLPNTNIDGVLEAPGGGVWVSTDKGIARIDPQTFAMRRLSEAEGVAFANNWADGADVTADGLLVFAGVGGLTFIDPRFPVHAPAPAVMVTDLRLGDRPLSPQAGEVDIRPGAGPLSVSFASPDLAAAGRIGFAYRLAGLDKAWTRLATNRRTTEFTHLPPGRYTLEVQATDRQGRPGGALRRIAVIVHPSLTQTLWFRAGLVLLALAGCLVALLLRSRAQKRRQAHLESLVERRTAELRCSQAELERLAYFDPLTGLANRRMFQELLAGLMRPEAPQAFALLLGDLDRFKTINDSLGHDAGDAMLSQVAARLASTVRARDSVCRLGGDEFALLIHDVGGPEEVEALCARLLATMEEPVFFEGRAMHTGLSLGVALHPAHATGAAELYKLADTALYAAKAAGRGTWRHAQGRARTAA